MLDRNNDVIWAAGEPGCRGRGDTVTPPTRVTAGKQDRSLQPGLPTDVTIAVSPCQHRRRRLGAVRDARKEGARPHAVMLQALRNF